MKALSNLEQLFFSTEEKNRLLALELAKDEGIHQEFIENIYKALEEIPEFPIRCLWYIKNEYEDQNRKPPEGLELKEVYIKYFFDKVLSHEKVDLTREHNAIKVFPKILLKCKHIKYLYLTSNDIDTIPNDISELSGLLSLSLAHNKKLNKLPKGMGKLKKLESLSLQGIHDIFLNGLSYNDFNPDIHPRPILSDCIRQMTSLKHLYLGDNWIVRIPEWIAELKHLETLCIKTSDGGYPYLYIPDTIVELSSLETYEIRTFTTTIPADINRLQKLKKLVVTNADFIPTSIKYLKKLKSLDLSYFDNDLACHLEGYSTIEELYDPLEEKSYIPKNKSRIEVYGWQWLKEMTWLQEFTFVHIEPYAFTDLEKEELTLALPHCHFIFQE
jgi:hypothetical protein